MARRAKTPAPIPERRSLPVRCISACGIAMKYDIRPITQWVREGYRPGVFGKSMASFIIPAGRPDKIFIDLLQLSPPENIFSSSPPRRSHNLPDWPSGQLRVCELFAMDERHVVPRASRSRFGISFWDRLTCTSHSPFKAGLAHLHRRRENDRARTTACEGSGGGRRAHDDGSAQVQQGQSNL